jgi:hypothetical protein
VRAWFAAHLRQQVETQLDARAHFDRLRGAIMTGSSRTRRRFIRPPA